MPSAPSAAVPFLRQGHPLFFLESKMLCVHLQGFFLLPDFFLLPVELPCEICLFSVLKCLEFIDYLFVFKNKAQKSR